MEEEDGVGGVDLAEGEGLGWGAEDGVVFGGVDGGGGVGGGFDLETGGVSCGMVGGGGSYVGGESEFERRERRAGGSSRSRIGERLWEKEKGIPGLFWVDIVGELGGGEGQCWTRGGIS